jgi:hypothetical protein
MEAKSTLPIWAKTRDNSAQQSWKRTVLLVIAVTIHNIPGAEFWLLLTAEGLAVGVGFASVGSVPSATFASARLSKTAVIPKERIAPF